MEVNCPSCSAPLEPAPTVIGTESSTQGSRCGRCGYEVPPDNQPPHKARHQGDATSDEPMDADQATVLQQSGADTADQIAHFLLKRIVGQGSFGAVWLAEDLQLKRNVALKLPTRAADSQLIHEAQTAARLSHANIVPVFEVGEDHGQPFIASEYIEGRTLRDELKEGRVAEQRIVEVMATIAHAAHYAHENGVIHRDMKPANVMIDVKGVPHITDFGIAKSVSEDETISLDGEIVGTIAYMAPEQASGQNSNTDRRADIYAMGVMLFELLTESRPFRGNAQGILVQKTAEDAPSPRALVPTLDRDLETICLKCLERDTAKRYPTAQALAEELERYQQNIPIKARPTSSVEKAWRWCRRNPGITAAISFSFATLIVALVVIGRFWQQAVVSGQQTTATLFRAHMNVAARRLYDGDVTGARQILNKYDDQSPDDFSWRHLRHVSSAFRQIVRHGGRIADVAVSREGRLMATIDTQHLRVREPDSGQLIRTLTAGSYRFISAEFSPADDRLLTVCSDGIIRVWNPAAHDHTAFELKHGSGLKCARFSPDRRFIVSGGADGTVRRWMVAEPDAPPVKIHAVDGSVLVVEFSPDSRFVGFMVTQGTAANQQQKRRVLVFDLENQQPIYETPLTASMTDFCFDGTLQAITTVTQSGLISRFSLTDRQPLITRSLARHYFGDVQFLPGTELRATTDLGGITRIFDGQLQSVSEFHTHNRSFGIMDCSRDGRHFVVGSGDGTARVLSTDVLVQRQTAWLPDSCRDIAFRGDSKMLFMAGGDGSLKAWDLSSGKVSDLLPVPDRSRVMLSLAVNPVTQEIATCGMMKELRLTDATGSKHRETMLPFGGHAVVDVSPDGSTYVVGGRDGAVLFFDTQDLTAEPVRYEANHDEVTAVCYAPDCDGPFVAWADGSVELLNPDGTLNRVLILLEDQPLSVVHCHPYLAVGTGRGYVRLINPETGKESAAIKADAGLTSGLAVLPKQRQVISGGLNGKVMIWDTESQELIASLPGHRQRIFAIAVSPDGRFVASAGLSGDVRLWSTE